MIPPFIVALLRDPLLSFILIFLVGFLGLMLLVVYRSRLRLDRKIQDWPSVTGKITTSRYHAASYLRTSGSGTESVIRFVPTIKYSYAVQGTEYHADRIGNSSYTTVLSIGPKRLVKRFPVGASVPVYYDPADPGQAVLEKTMFANTLGLLAGIIFCLVGVLIFGLWVSNLVAGH